MLQVRLDEIGLEMKILERVGVAPIVEKMEESCLGGLGM